MTKTLPDNLTALLNEVTNADHEWREAKRTAAERARRRAEREVADLLAKRDQAVRKAVDAGLPLVELRRKHHGLHTTNQSTVLESLRRTEHYAELDAAEKTVEQEQAPSALYAIEGDSLVITPPAAEVDALVARLDFEEDTVTPYAAQFTRTERGKLDPVDGITIPGTLDRNPVVIWAQRADNEAAAVAWWDERVAA